jgi:very-short-patch-repair endonuclease
MKKGPMRGKRHSDETRKKMSETHRRIGTWKGRHHSKESIKKMSESQKDFLQKENHPMLGKHHSEDSKQKISDSLKGNIPWNKGTPRSEKTKMKLSKALKGRIISDETKKKMSDAGKKRMLNEELKNKLAKAAIGNKQSKEQRKKSSERMKRVRKTIIFPKKDSSIEVKIQEYLKELRIEFFTHQYIDDIDHGYQCDIFIPSMNLIIECDGDYWHKYPVGRALDHVRTMELMNQGFQVLRLWERDIKSMSIEDFKAKISEFNTHNEVQI